MSTGRGIEVAAVVVGRNRGEVLRARLANGHEFIAILPRSGRSNRRMPVEGERVRVRFSPCDLSKGRVIVEGKTRQ